MADPADLPANETDPSGATPPGELHFSVNHPANATNPGLPIAPGSTPAPATAVGAPAEPHDPWADGGTPAPAVPAANPGDSASVAAPGPHDPWADGGGPGSSTPAEKIGGALATGTKAALTTAGAITGMEVGAGMGAVAGAVFPPAEAVTVPVGALGGLIAGWYATEKAAQAANLPDPQELPGDQRPLGEFGAMVGGAVSIGGSLNAAAKMGVDTGIPFIERIIESAKGSPLTAIRTQLTPGITAGWAGGEAEEHDPGNAWLRVPLEIAGGALSPGAMLSGAFDRTASVFNYARSVMGSEAQQSFAAKTLYRALHLGGEDPNTIRAVLANPDAMGLDAPGLNDMAVAQLTNSPAIAKLEASLTGMSKPFSAEMAAKTQAALDAMKNMLVSMLKIGDPAAMTAAAEGRASYFRGMFSAAVEDQVQQAVDAAKEITGDTQAAIPELSLRVTNGVQKVLDLVKDVENEAWNAVDKTIPGDAPNVVAAADKLRGNIMGEDGETLPELIESFSTRMKEAMEEDTSGAGATTTGELLKFRSRMLALARQASSGPTPNFLQADQFGKMATAALDDLGKIGDSVPGGEFKTAFDNARQITAEKMEVFYRTFVGKAITTGRAGEASVEPEAYLSRALGNGGVMGDVRMQQIQHATEFMGSLAAKDGSPLTIAGPEADAAAASVADAQSRIVRLAAAKALDPVTRRVNLKALTKFINENGNLIDRFPGLRDDLENATSSEAAAQKALDSDNPMADDAAALEKAAGPDSGVDGVAAVLKGANPQTGLQRLIDAVKAPKAPAGAADGLRAAVLQDAMNRATVGGKLDFDKLDELLNQPMRDSLPSSVSMLRNGGIMADDQAGRLTKIIALGQRVQAGTAPLAAAQAETAAPDVIEALAKIGGSRIGAAVSKRLIGGTTLVGQAYIAKLSDYLLRKAMPDNLIAILQNAVKDPKAMADLLKRPDTSQEAETLLGRIVGYGKSVGNGPLGYAAEAIAGQRQLNVLPELGQKGPKNSSQEPARDDSAIVAPAEAATPPSRAPASAPGPVKAVPTPGKAENGRDLLPLVRNLENSDDNAVSPVGAVGRHQIMLATARHYDPSATVEKLKNPAYNEKIAGDILDDLFKTYHGNVAQVLANYNASPRATKAFVKTGDPSSLPSETQAYLQRAKSMGAIQ